MLLHNTTTMRAGYTLGIQPDGRERLVVVVKGAFTIPGPGEEPKPAAEQPPLVETDLFTGEPGFSATRYEMDFAPRKPRCDVLLNGSAHAPGGKPAEQVTVSLRVGALTKSFDVVGNRVWRAGALYISASPPEPFTKMPISYNNAFGGVDRAHEDPQRWRFYPLNFAGVGYHEHTAAKVLDGRPLPNTEERGHAITRPGGRYKPMAFGPVGRGWQPRIKWAGTYDKKWLDEGFPFLPKDFDERYYQTAPEDQQTDYPSGGEEVELVNLTPQGRTLFKLPRRLRLPVVFFHRNGSRKEVPAVVDTFLIEPDEKRFALVWRASFPLARTIREIQTAAVGQTARQWERLEERKRRTSGKRCFASLSDWIRARQSSVE